MTTADPNSEALTDDDLKALLNALHAEQTSLVNDINQRSGDVAPVQLDQQSVGRLSRMDAMQGQAMAQAQNRRRQHRLSQIDAALHRIEEGEFGFCQTCGESIPKARLAIDPAVTRCVRCA